MSQLTEQLNKLLDMTCTHIKEGINKIAEEDIIVKTTQSIEEIINNEPDVKTLLNLFINNKTTTETLLEIRAKLSSQENHIKIIEDILECKKIDIKTVNETIELTTNIINSNDKEINELNSKIKSLKEKNKMYKSLNKIYKEVIDNQEEDCNE